MVLAGILPMMLLLGGGLAIYLGFDELKDTWKKDETVAPAGPDPEIDKYKQEIEDLKKEVENLKSNPKD